MYHEGRCCYICGKNGMQDPLEEHHVFGGSLRKKSTKYKAVVYLCGNEHHRNGKDSVHKNRLVSDNLKAEFQKKIMEREGWDMDRWMLEFYKNYI